jgi:hypothetical protein
MTWRGEQEGTQQFFTDPFDEERSNGSPQKAWLGRYKNIRAPRAKVRWLIARGLCALAAIRTRQKCESRLKYKISNWKRFRVIKYATAND